MDWRAVFHPATSQLYLSRRHVPAAVDMALRQRFRWFGFASSYPVGRVPIGASHYETRHHLTHLPLASQGHVFRSGSDESSAGGAGDASDGTLMSATNAPQPHRRPHAAAMAARCRIVPVFPIFFVVSRHVALVMPFNLCRRRCTRQYDLPTLRTLMYGRYPFGRRMVYALGRHTAAACLREVRVV
jgi:hypothetical protein